MLESTDKDLEELKDKHTETNKNLWWIHFDIWQN